MAVSKNDMFFSSKIKIERSKHHIHELNNELVNYLNTKPFRVVIEKDPESTNHLWTLRVKNELPLKVSAILGDAIHNLRASLDLLASNLVLMAGGNTKDVYFPFAKDAISLDEMIKKKHVDRAGDEIVNIIKSLKPYIGGNEMLRAIHDLDIIDKHKTLIPSTHYTGIENFQLLNNDGSTIFSLANIHFGPIEDGMVLMSLPPVRNISIGQTFQPTLKITLDECSFAPDDEVIFLLNAFILLVEGIINKFDEHFKTKRTP